MSWIFLNHASSQGENQSRETVSVCLKGYRGRWHGDTDKWWRFAADVLSGPVARLCAVQKTHEGLLFVCEARCCDIVGNVPRGQARKIKSREQKAKRDVPAVYLGSAAGWRPWPDLRITPCNDSVNMTVQCRWRGTGQWWERPLSKQSLYVCQRKTAYLLRGQCHWLWSKEETFLRRPPSSFHLSSTLSPSISQRERGVTVINGPLYDCSSVSCVCLELSKLNLFGFSDEEECCTRAHEHRTRRIHTYCR